MLTGARGRPGPHAVREEQAEHELEVRLRGLVVRVQADGVHERRHRAVGLVRIRATARGEVAERQHPEQVARLRCAARIGAPGQVGERELRLGPPALSPDLRVEGPWAPYVSRKRRIARRAAMSSPTPSTLPASPNTAVDACQRAVAGETV